MIQTDWATRYYFNYIHSSYLLRWGGLEFGLLEGGGQVSTDQFQLIIFKLFA